MKCEDCGATTRLDTGVCVSCLLRAGLEAVAGMSQADFQRVLDEIDVPDKEWHLGNYEILAEIGRGGNGGDLSCAPTTLAQNRGRKAHPKLSS